MIQTIIEVFSFNYMGNTWAIFKMAAFRKNNTNQEHSILHCYYSIVKAPLEGRTPGIGVVHTSSFTKWHVRVTVVTMTLIK